MAGNLSAFKPLKRKKRILDRINPPKKHMLAQMTGGYKNLISGQTTSIVHCDEYTTKDGKFIPNNKMPLIIGRYKFIKILEFGQSACVISAKDECNGGKLVSIKVMHVHNTAVSYQEVDCLVKLNAADVYHASSTIRLLHTFTFDKHFCMVFDMLDATPLTYYFKKLITESDILIAIRQVTIRLLVSLGFLRRENTLHADIKPANILLERPNDFRSCTLIDFGNAIKCVEEELSLYYDDYNLVTLLYRPPEVMFGCDFGLPVDMWSLGCVLAEFYLKSPIFSGSNNKQIVKQMVNILGPIPRKLFKNGLFYESYAPLTEDIDEQLPSTLLLKNQAQINNVEFCNFLSGLFQYDVKKRVTPSEAARHPFLASELGILYLQPCADENVSEQLHYPPLSITESEYNIEPKRNEYKNSKNLLNSNVTNTLFKPKPRIANVDINFLSSNNSKKYGDSNNNCNLLSNDATTKNIIDSKIKRKAQSTAELYTCNSKYRKQ